MTERYESIGDLEDILTSLGAERALLVTGPSARFAERVRALLPDTTLAVFSGARKHVPAAVVNDARAALDALAPAGTRAALIALGGGAAIGVCKALRLEREVGFVAVPTTYSGSEMTDIYGVRRGDDKVTGRDPRVRPDAIIHDVELTVGMPRGLTVASLMNALAHPIAALTSRAESEPDRPALDAISDAFTALEELVEQPTSRRARARASSAAAAAAKTLERGALGIHHRLAHRFGGRFDLDHGTVHSVLLPHTVSYLRGRVPATLAAIDQAVRLPDLEAALFDVLGRSGQPTSLAALGVNAGQLDELLAAEAELPRELVRAAWHGRRPSREVRREDWGLREPVSVRGSIAGARRVVVALHGRGAQADGIVRRVLEIVGDDPAVTVVAPHAPGNSWYSRSFEAPRGEIGEALEAAVREVGEVLTRVLAEVGGDRDRVALFGFSQGACLALEVMRRRGAPLAALVALSGGATGTDEEVRADQARAAPGRLANMPVLLGVSTGDRWIRWARAEATATLMRALGAEVRLERVPGDAHALHPRHRLLARPLLRGVEPRPTATGLHNAHSWEGLPGALPVELNTPRRAPYGLYPEQLSLSAFTAPRAANRRVWVYRVRPAASQGRFEPREHPTLAGDFLGGPPEANLFALSPPDIPDVPRDFVDGLITIGGAGAATLRRGFAVHLYAANRNMEDRAFCNQDGDLLILPQRGDLTIFTELGVLEVAPGSVALIPRGVRFSVQLVQDGARGWVAESFGAGFDLPERGPVGANGLADARHFEGPEPFYEDRLAPGYRIAMKLGGALSEAVQDHSPFDVVAWHGNAIPMRYDLSRFNPIGFVRVDHIDPSAHTVLSAPLDDDGANALDLVAFVPRWDVSEGTFRPPYFHRNVTTEINGIIANPAPSGSPFQPGVTFLTPSGVPHGVVASAVERNLALDDGSADRPSRSSDGSLWFQFESALPLILTPWIAACELARSDWAEVWGAYRCHFSTH